MLDEARLIELRNYAFDCVCVIDELLAAREALSACKKVIADELEVRVMSFGESPEGEAGKRIDECTKALRLIAFAEGDQLAVPRKVEE